MNFRYKMIHSIVVSIALLSCTAVATAQQTGGTTEETSGGDTGGATGSGALDTEPDTSAFDSIERGDSVSSSSATGFGNSATQGGTTGRAAAGGFGGFGGLGGLGGLFGGNNFGAGSASAKPLIRTRLRSAVQVAPMPVKRVEMNANARIYQLPQRQGLQNVQINMVGRTAVIEGTAATDRDRRMAELLMRLEPGVSQVTNKLTIAP